MSEAVPSLTSLSHGGGCGCKIAPGVLAEWLKGSLPNRRFADLMSVPKPRTTPRFTA